MALATDATKTFHSPNIAHTVIFFKNFGFFYLTQQLDKNKYYSHYCGHMSDLLIPATVTGFFMASRRKGSPSS